MSIFTGIGYFKKRIDGYAKEIIQENFKEEKKKYQEEIKKTVGSEPIGRFLYNSEWVDTLVKIYPFINTKYKVSGLYINPQSGHRYYIDHNGIEYKVFKDNSGNFYYFDSKINFISK